jgi:hypothetical protein
LRNLVNKGFASICSLMTDTHETTSGWGLMNPPLDELP